MNQEKKNKLQRYCGSILSLILLGAGLFVMYRTFGQYSWAEVKSHLADITYRQLLWAVFFCFANYLLLTFYDYLSFSYIKVRLSYPAIALASFVSFTFSHNVGAALVSGGGVRYRIYSAWGVSAANVGRIVLFTGTNYWIGFFLLGGIVLLLHPLQLPPQIAWIGEESYLLGVFFLSFVFAYLAMLLFRRNPIRLYGYSLPVPTLPLTFQVGSIACLDWMFAAATLHVLLPPEVPFFMLLGVFFIAQVAGIISHVPGGIGVFEGIMFAFLAPVVNDAHILSAMLLFRLIYYIGPFFLGLGLFGIFEGYIRKRITRRSMSTDVCLTTTS